MKSYHALFIGLGIVGIIILYVIWNIGLMKPVIVEQVLVPEQHLVYVKYQGPYQNVGPLFKEVEDSLAQQKITCNQTFGRYYDNPNEIEAERTRADIGCLFTEAVSVPADSKLQLDTVAAHPAIVGTFEGAPWLTAFKVYRAVRQEAFQRNIMIDDSVPVVETYDKMQHGFRTKVYFSLKK